MAQDGVEKLLASGLRRIGPYENVGPYGELLWHLLGDFKRSFVKRLTLPQGGDEQDLERKRLTLLRGTRGTLEWFDSPSSPGWRDHLFDHWPSNHHRDKKIELIEERRRQLKEYLADLVRLLGSAQNASATERGAVLWQALERLVWPYYFLVVPGSETNRGHAGDDYMITWLPAYELIARRHPRARQRSQGEQPAVGPAPLCSEESADPAELLYPSLHGLLEEDGEPSTELVRVLQDSLRLGDLDLDPDSSSKDAFPVRDVGHVQPLKPESLLPEWDRIVEPDVIPHAHPRSRFSDTFYLNRTAFRLTFRRDDDSTPIGRLFVCSPLPVGTFREMWPSTEESPDSSVFEAMEGAWKEVSGPVVAEVMYRRWDQTRQNLLRKSWLEMIGYGSHLVQHTANNVAAAIINPRLETTTIACMAKALSWAASASRSFMPRLGDGTDWVKAGSYQVEIQGERGKRIGLEYALGQLNLPHMSVDVDLQLVSDDDKINVRLPAILLELVWNMKRHSDPFREREGALSIADQAAGMIFIQARSRVHKLEKFLGLRDRLRMAEQDPGNHWTGVPQLLHLIGGMVPPGGDQEVQGTWTFLPEETTGAIMTPTEHCTWEGQGGVWQLRLPKRLGKLVEEGTADLSLAGEVRFHSCSLQGAIRRNPPKKVPLR